MARKSLKEQLQDEIEAAIKRRDEAQTRFDTWADTLKDATNQLGCLRKALAALEGKPETKFPDLLAPQLAPMTVLQAPQNGNEATLNGEKIILEPGQRIGKNSFGEDCILTAEMGDYLPMAEPTKPAPTTHGVVLPATNETLDRPEDML